MIRILAIGDQEEGLRELGVQRPFTGKLQVIGEYNTTQYESMRTVQP